MIKTYYEALGIPDFSSKTVIEYAYKNYPKNAPEEARILAKVSYEYLIENKVYYDIELMTKPYDKPVKTVNKQYPINKQNPLKTQLKTTNIYKQSDMQYNHRHARQPIDTRHPRSPGSEFAIGFAIGVFIFLILGVIL